MQSDLIIKENELLNPQDYPEEQRALVEDFNQRIKRCTGVVTGIGKEYHTIWIVRIDDLSMSLYRSTGENTTRGAVEIGQRFGSFDRFILEYTNRYVVDRIESIQHDTEPEVVLDRIKNGDLYTVDYMRMSDDGNISYHQMAFALAGEPGEAENFLLAYRDIDKSIRRHIADKRYLREQLDIVEALSRDYYNIFKVDLVTGDVVILKLDGYVTKGMDKPSDKIYPYDVLYRQYVKDRVYIEDQPAMIEAMSIDTVRAKLQEVEEYVSSYRVMDRGEVHYYQFTYLPINPHNLNSGILAGFKNVDDIVESAKERETLETLAHMDMMTGILNRGSGERKVIDALANGREGMFCIMDIDSFKTINDSYGHDVGDKVIRGIADIIKTSFRDNDVLFRLGGDEYAVFAHGVTDVESGRVMVERVFEKIGSMEIPELSGHEVTISVGGAFATSGERHDFEDLYRKADKCVYDSKAQKGCTLVFYSAD